MAPRSSLRRSPGGWASTALAITAGLAACASGLGGIQALASAPADLPASQSPQVEMKYLGVGGWLFRWRGQTILTAPFFTNPGLLTVGLWSLTPDTALIDRFMPPAPEASAILVGHAHYDHLMDVPYVARRHAPKAVIYGSATTRNILAAAGVPFDRRVSLNDRAGDAVDPGEWITVADGRIRFMALRSDHAPHWMRIELYEGRYDVRQNEMPDFAWEWVGGQTLAFLIDFLDEEGRPAFRVHYADATHERPTGHVPPELLEERAVDLAILCPPSYEQVSGYPEDIVNALAPRFVLLGHWEDFFRPRTRPLRVVAGFDLEDFVSRLETVMPEGSRWWLPEPGLSLTLPADTGPPAARGMPGSPAPGLGVVPERSRR